MGPGEQGFFFGGGRKKVPFLSCNDSPGHVTAGSHRGTG